MKKDTIQWPSLKELEVELFATLQKTFGDVLTKTLEEIDHQIAESRDKKRFDLQDKRSFEMDTTFGPIHISRNYYKDREQRKYVCLLDQYLEFEGTKGVSPLVETMAMELAVQGTSYRHASATIEKLLGYKVLSHETIRQHLLQTEVCFQKQTGYTGKVLFVEVDGLFIKRQHSRTRGREEKIAAVHEGWMMNGKRASLIGKRHYVHKGKESFWDGFEQFLMDNYNYNPNDYLLVINGDGALWITACRDQFKNAFFVIDRFHVARDIRAIFKGHKRYRYIRKKLATYDESGLLTELNSAVGTLEDENLEERLEELINRLSKYPEALGDYRRWLKEKGIDTGKYRPMGSAEGTMSVFAKRLKNGRSWSETGIHAFIDFMIGLKDQLEIKTILGTLNHTVEFPSQPTPKYYVEKLKSTVGEATRNNLWYLKQGKGKPIYEALSTIRGL
ncbi:ISLre2 family transposase [Metabacillus sp. HB246100]